MWTVSASGCPCPWNATQTDCACCVKEGGCHCGEAAPQRCAQCGLEKYCANSEYACTADAWIIPSALGHKFLCKLNKA